MSAAGSARPRRRATNAGADAHRGDRRSDRGGSRMSPQRHASIRRLSDFGVGPPAGCRFAPSGEFRVAGDRTPAVAAKFRKRLRGEISLRRYFEFPKGRGKPLLCEVAERRQALRPEFAGRAASRSNGSPRSARPGAAEQSRERADHVVREHGAGGKLLSASLSMNGLNRSRKGMNGTNRGKEHVIDPPQEHGIHAAVPRVPAHVPATLAVVHAPAIVPARVPAPVMK